MDWDANQTRAYAHTISDLGIGIRETGEVHAADSDIDWTGLTIHAEHEQQARGIQYSPNSALLKAIMAAQNPELHVALGETTYHEPSGQDRVYALGESADTTVKNLFVWDAAAGKVVSHKVRG